VLGENIVGLAVQSDIGRIYDFSQIYQDNYYKRPSAQLITKIKTSQPGSQNLAWGRPHFQSRKVCLPKPIFNILFISFE
jgi:hypothetical protein